MLNINDALAHHRYCTDSARSMLAFADDDPRLISADQLESACFAPLALFAPFCDYAPEQPDFDLEITFCLICAIIMNLTNCAYADICADY